jgi:membrane dipeptidase
MRRADVPLLWDMVVPLAREVGNDWTLIERFRGAGHHFISLTIAGDDCGLAEAMHRLAQARREIAARGATLSLATSLREIEAARAQGRLAVGLHLEGTECLERDLDMLDAMYALGIRHAILAFNQNNSAAGGCADIDDAGLSRFGRRVVDRMGELGMLLDGSHTGERSSLEAIERIGQPVVFTHSNARALHDHYRNVSDRQARACADSGGLIGISGSSVYLGDWNDLAEGVFAHIDHFVQSIGPEHVGIGTDFVADAGTVMRIFADRPDEWPPAAVGGFDKVTYLPPEDIWRVVARMTSAGYGDAVIAGILGGNYARIARAVWK